MLRWSALPKRCTNMTAPPRAFTRLCPLRLINHDSIARTTMRSTEPIASGSLANKNRNGNGTLSTHWRIGTSGSTSSTSNAAVPTMRRAPQLGHQPRRLQENATSFSAWHASQRTRRKPCSSRPHFRYASNSRRTNPGSGRPSASIRSANAG
jgi:hypothetical protein